MRWRRPPPLDLGRIIADLPGGVNLGTVTIQEPPLAAALGIDDAGSVV